MYILYLATANLSSVLLLFFKYFYLDFSQIRDIEIETEIDIEIEIDTYIDIE